VAEDGASLSETLGAALRRCREERDLTQDEVSRRVRERFPGLRWGRPTVSLIESGDRELTLTEVVALLDVLGTDLTELLGDAEEVELAHDVSGGMAVRGRDLVSGLVKGPMPKIVQVHFSSRIPEELEVARDLGEMDYKAATRLGVEPPEVAAAARRLYGRSLTEEREARLERRGPATMTPAQRRAILGHVSRELYVELAEALEGRR
jgi:transcriptional regulator with XRE-family HTH domain